MLLTAIVGVDGRPQDAEAIALGRRLVSAGGSLILATVAVVSDPSLPSREDEDAVERAETLIDRLTEEHEEVQGVAVAAASIGDGLRQLAEGSDAEITIVASSRRGVLGRIFAGDAVRDVIEAASGPVAVAPIGYKPPA